MEKYSETVEVVNELGLHARPASLIVKTSTAFSSEIQLCNQDGYAANGKSIISVMGLEAACGSQVKITANGSDAEPAVKAIMKLFADKFYED